MIVPGIELIMQGPGKDDTNKVRCEHGTGHINR